MQDKHIYTIENPINNEIVYVGSTFDAKKRMKDHRNLHGSTKLSVWFDSMVSSGIMPVMQIIDTVDKSESDFWEQYYISLFKSWGFDLKNRFFGNGNKWNHDKETKDYFSKIRRGIKKTDEFKKKIESSGVYERKSIFMKENNPMKNPYVAKKVGLTRKRNGVGNKPIDQFSKDGVFIKRFNSVLDAANDTGLFPQNISQSTNRPRGTAGGFVWRHVTDKN